MKPLTDRFARAALLHANERITQLETELKDLRARVPKRPVHHAACTLCGAPCKPTRRYCHAHAWAEGTE